MSEDMPQVALSEDEYQKGATTNQFIETATEAQIAINDTVGHARVLSDMDGVTVDTGGPTSGVRSGRWPEDRAMRVTEELATLPGSGLDMQAARKVDDLRDEANRVNKAHDTVTSNGQNIPPFRSEAEIQRKIKSEGTYGKYSTKQGDAVRVDGSTFDNEESFKSGKRKAFAPHHQDKARKAIVSLEEKQMHRINDEHRKDEIRAAKAVLGRAGVKIPKENPPEGKPPEPLDIAA